ncbi:MAG TPA: ABC transporter substrate-binding protein [Gemmatimonadales bacterium]|nr:ABC transporter substrate-binding protein [Gemmatimonadales bacterium]
MGPPTACLLAQPEGARRDTITIALTEPVNPADAPVPANRAERLVFAQLYEPLVRTNCRGVLEPALGVSWSPQDGGPGWMVTLPADAHFADGAPVTAAEVVAGWRERGGTDVAGAATPLGATAVAPIAQAATALGDRRIAVALPAAAAHDSGPAGLGGLGFAATRAGRGAWPVGTGPYVIDSIDAGRAPERQLVARPIEADSALPVLRFILALGADPRDLLDAGADVLLTDDPAVLAYAASRAALETVALPWDRTYVLVAHAGSPAAAPFTPETRAGLARDAVRIEARAADSDSAALACTPSGAHSKAPVSAASPRAPRILYARGDTVARDLAARLVALGRAGPDARAVGVEPDALARAVREGSAAGAVLSLPHRPETLCSAAAAWAPPDFSVEPLIDVRAHAVIRRGTPMPTVDADGTLRWTAAGVPPDSDVATP